MSKNKTVNANNFESDSLPKADFIPEPGDDFVVTPYIEDLTNRALAYLRVGYAVHLSGPAGTGKSTLAMHIASQLGQPCTLLHGDDEFKASDLLGRDTGYQKSSTVDNYISSIVKTEESVSLVWTSNRLTTACQKGHTLIYDEFTRSPATANNPFLSILEEGILNIPSSGREKGYIRVDPSFRAIFTSNPEEYVGVHKTQDALLDRMITIELEYPDCETEVAIVHAKSERSLEDSEHIVRIVRTVRDNLGGKNGPTVRAAIAIARILNHRGCEIDVNDPIFLTTCKDVLTFCVCRQGEQERLKSQLESIIKQLGKTDGGRSATNSSEEHLLESTFELSRTIDQGLARNEPTSALIASELSGSVPTDIESGHKKPRPQSTSASPLRTPRVSDSEKPATGPVYTLDSGRRVPPPHTSTDRGMSETASPQQMLEAAVNRFIRPPQTNLSLDETTGLASS